eukprot:TRINITY_DN3610_c0_g1_i2.p1 TRINITY_DN3610_c0_g1~~TRINITY_DN3610_c0_g1_i2.p1  ORF type:complete len:1064 (+),score=197.22 TRINITY_DN3610_c0_g1_i2:1216-4407(+)
MFFSQMIFNKNKEEAKKRTAAASIESQLSMQWEDFMATLPDIKKPEFQRIRDHYSEEEQKKLDFQGGAIVNALKGKDSLPKKTSWLDRIDEEEVERKKEEKKALMHGLGGKKYAVDPILKANPNIAKDADYEFLFGECLDEEPGLYIWRIEHFLPVDVDPSEYPHPDKNVPGKLHSEDCYLVLHITAEEKAKRFVIYTWFGERSTVDKRGACAFRARELSIFLGGKPKIQIEYELDESEKFLELYGDDPGYAMTGGTESGFRPAVKFLQKPRLYRLHVDSRVDVPRAERITFYQVELSYKSLNQSDVFILDGGTDLNLWQWNGAYSLAHLRYEATQILMRINRFDRMCRCRIIIMDEGTERKHILRTTRIHKRKRYVRSRSWWDYFADKPQPNENDILPHAGPDSKDTSFLVKLSLGADLKPRLVTIRQSPNSSKKSASSTATGPLMKEMLESGFCFILCTSTEVFVWVGKLYWKNYDRSKLINSKFNRRDFKVARALASTLRQKFKCPPWAPITIEYEGSESTSFLCKFPYWRAKLFTAFPDNYVTAQIIPDSIAPYQPYAQIDIETLLGAQQRLEVEEKPPTQGSVEVWAIEDGRPTFKKLPAAERGTFYTRDCYMVLYTYYDVDDKMKRAYTAYFWEGRSSAASKWWASFLTGFFPVLKKKIMLSGGKTPVKVRVREHKEPKEFVTLFGGHILVKLGARKQALSGFTHAKELYHVRRTTKDITHTMQVPLEVNSLNSFDSFILKTEKMLWVWYGKKIKFEDSHVVEEISEKIQNKLEKTVLDEGEEIIEFWNCFPGGWAEHDNNQEYTEKYAVPPRLFKFSNETGSFCMTEIFEYYQTDLLERNVYILDTYNEIYMWSGNNASESLSNQVLSVARKIVIAAAQKRDKEQLPLIKVDAGEETFDFTRHFHTWAFVEKFDDPMEAREERLADLLFEEYKKNEAQKRKQKDLLRVSLAAQTKRRIDWVQVLLLEMPELVAWHEEEDEDVEVDSDSDVEIFSSETDDSEIDEYESDSEDSADDDLPQGTFVYERTFVEEDAKEERVNVVEDMITRISNAKKKSK